MRNQDLARGASPATAVATEPGASNNRLSLDPNDPAFDFVKAWVDGRTYRVMAEITQVSPGEFEVVSAHQAGAPAEEPEETEEVEDQTGSMGVASDKPGYKNPAVARLMEE